MVEKSCENCDHYGTRILNKFGNTIYRWAGVYIGNPANGCSEWEVKKL